MSVIDSGGKMDSGGEERPWVMGMVDQQSESRRNFLMRYKFWVKTMAMNCKIYIFENKKFLILFSS